MADKDFFNIKKDEDFSEWYIELVRRAKLMDQRSPTKGFDVVMPNAYHIWEKIQEFSNPEFKALGARNAYFPLVIPESLLKEEAEHFEGFMPEVAWVTHGGEEKLDNRLAIRPTSETIINNMYKLWIRSYQDLPLQTNQWCNIVRWETKMTKPFIRGREFLWQEGHSCFASAKEAKENQAQVLDVYKKLLEERLKIACFFVKRPEWDKFAGAEDTVSLETLMPDGKVLQAGTVHNMGTHFSRPMEISFLDENNNKTFVHQTTWGVSTRLIGATVMTHGDDKGLVLPMELAPVQIVILPIIFKGKKEDAIFKKCEEMRLLLENAGFIVEIDASDKRPGEKHYHWELMGTPIRIEIGPRDIEENKVVIASRLGNKKPIDEKELLNEVEKEAIELDNVLLMHSTKHLIENIREAKTLDVIENVIAEGGIAKSPWCSCEMSGVDCDEQLKASISAEVRGTLYPTAGIPDNGDKCPVCGKDATTIVYIAKAY